MEELLKKLNDEQYQAVVTNEQYVRVIAGAGSGKTRVLATRIAYLIDNIGAISNRILAITFTNKAADEMRKRVDKYLGIENCGAHISTYHSFCARFLREEAYQLGYPKSYTIIDEEDQDRIIKKIIKEYDEKVNITPKSARSYISYQKNMGFAPDVNQVLNPYDSKRIKEEIYESYEKILQENHYFDFDDLLINAVAILRSNKRTLAKWKERFDYILVDEFQDTNDIQYELLKLLSGPNTSIFVVGDPDQTIYTWRGANVNVIMNFPKDFKGTVDYILKQNYRSTSTILNCANSLISHNIKRVPKDLVAVKEGGEKIYYYGPESVEKEADWIIDRIKELKKKDKTITYGDIAVLYRSNYYSGGLEKSFIHYKIPYNIYGGVKFFSRKEVKDAIAHLRLLINDDDYIALERVINEPRRGIGQKTMQDFYKKAEEEGKTIVRYLLDTYNKEDAKGKLADFCKPIVKCRERLQDPKIHESYGIMLENLLTDVGYIDMLLSDKLEGEDRLENVKELCGYLLNAQQNNENITLAEILQEITLYTAQDEIVDRDSVTLMTVHTAKGLEYPYVFVAGFSENVFPNSRSITDVITDDDNFTYISENTDKLEEERRLAYVAFTRAIDQLFISYNQGYNYASGASGIPSRFLLEIGSHVTPYRGLERPRYNQSSNRYFQPQKPHEDKTILKDNDADYRPGNMVMHTSFGEGIVLQVDDNAVTIAFKDNKIGVKKISRKFVGLSKKGA